MNYPEIDYITRPEVTLISNHSQDQTLNSEQLVKILLRVTRSASSILYALFNGRNNIILRDLDQDELVFMGPKFSSFTSNATEQVAIDEMGLIYEEAFTNYYLLGLGAPEQQANLVLPNGITIPIYMIRRTVPIYMTIPILVFQKFVEMDIPFWNEELIQVCDDFKIIYKQLFTETNFGAMTA